MDLRGKSSSKTSALTDLSFLAASAESLHEIESCGLCAMQTRTQVVMCHASLKTVHHVGSDFHKSQDVASQRKLAGVTLQSRPTWLHDHRVSSHPRFRRSPFVMTFECG